MTTPQRSDLSLYVAPDSSEGYSDEPVFPSAEHQQMYRDLVERMEREASVLPGMATAVGLMIRKLARDYVVSVMADQGEPAARSQERDRRMMSLMKMLLDQASRADLEHALRTEFVIGLVDGVVRVLDAEVSDDKLRVRLKELISHEFVTYTEAQRGRIT